MVSGAGSGGVDRIGGRGVDHVLDAGAARRAARATRCVRQELTARLQRGAHPRLDEPAGARAGESRTRARARRARVGKVHQGALNQRMQLLATALLGAGAAAWDGETPPEVRGMLRSRANTIEGGTTEVNKNILGERVLGLPREPDPWQGAAWRDVPRS